MEFVPQPARVHVIVPARNEQECIGRCLESLAGQRGIGFQVTLVDDGSTDRTRAIAESCGGVRVIGAAEPEAGIGGKCNALIAGAREARAPWLLFTDADTWHHPGSLAAAVAEAEDRGLDLLSYSPEQETGSWSEHALLPVVFAELARAYVFERVNDPADPAAAANGQYILVRRSVYEALGGHRRVAGEILEDVELARLFKHSGHAIWFGSGAGRVKTRMYRGFRSMCEGWTKNLALLFRHPARLALLRLLEFILISGGLLGGVMWAASHSAWGPVLLALGLGCSAVFLRRIRAARFSWKASLASIAGLPLFAWLLWRSWLHSRIGGSVTWKGRRYTRSTPPAASSSAYGVLAHDAPHRETDLNLKTNFIKTNFIKTNFRG